MDLDYYSRIGALFTCLKTTLIRVALLLCALGYSTTRPALPRRIAVGVTVLTLFYFGSILIQQYILVAKAAGLPVDAGGALLVDFLVLFGNFGFGVWILIALMGLLGILKRNGDRAAVLYAQYVRFFTAFFAMCVIAIIFFIAEVYASIFHTFPFRNTIH